MLQEVALPAFNLPGYDEAVNCGLHRRGTAILARESLKMSAPLLLPSGRAVSVKIGNLTVINVYAPAGTRLKAERARFYAEEITPLLAAAGDNFIIGGDLNCTLRSQDTTGHPNDCPQLSAIVSGFSLTDVWPTLRPDPGHTYFNSSMSSRLDRLYVTRCLSDKLVKADIIPVSFSDHLALACSLRAGRAEPATTRRTPKTWTLDASILSDAEFKESFAREWQLWASERACFSSAIDWWLRLVKPAIRRLAAEQTKRKRKDQNNLLDFLQGAMQGLYSKTSRSAANMETLKDIKKSINEVHADRLQGVAVRAKLHGNIADEPVSMYHVLKGRQRSRQQHIKTLRKDDGEILDGQDCIADHMLEVFTAKFRAPEGSTPPSSALVHLERTVTDVDNDSLTQDITEAELLAAIMSSPKGKSSGEDGLVAELYREMFPVMKADLLEVMRELWKCDAIPAEFLRGVVVFIPKKGGGDTVKGLRPLTMLNADMKIYSRILTVRLARLSDKLLHPSQVRPGGLRNMAASLCDLRDAISYLDHFQYAGCILTVDLAAAFDCVRHDYMFQVLNQRGVAPRFVQALQQLMTNATVQLRINGVMTASIPVKRSVPQGGPPSALLFAVVLAPLVTAIHRRLQGVGIADSKLRTSAYADDLYIVLRTPRDAQAVREELEDYGAVSGLHANHSKCAALPLGAWDTTKDIGWVYATEVKVLGLHFGNTVSASSKLTWNRVLQSVRGILIDSGNRNLSLSQRVWYASVYALSKLWHAAQVLPLDDDVRKKLNTAVAAFIWRGFLYRVPMEVIVRSRAQGGLGFPNLKLKCTSMLTGRWHTMRVLDPDGFSGEWAETVEMMVPVGNPPNVGAVWAAAPHYKEYLAAAAYGSLPGGLLDCKTLTKVVYDSLLSADLTHRAPPRVVRYAPGSNWIQVWANIASRVLTERVRDEWFACVHDIVPTKALMHARNMENNPNCGRCGVPDNLVHRLSECGDADGIWNWLQRLLRVLLKRDVDVGVLLRPDFKAGSAQKQATAVWICGQTVAYLAGGRKVLAHAFVAHIKREKELVLKSHWRWPKHLVEGLKTSIK